VQGAHNVQIPPQTNTPPTYSESTLKIIFATIIGIIFIIVMLLIAWFIEEPSSFQYGIFHVVLALAAAAFAAILPGAISANLPWGISAVGSLAVFIIIYFKSPAALVTQSTTSDTCSTIDCVDSLETFINQLPTTYGINTEAVLSSKLNDLFIFRKQAENTIAQNEQEITSLEDKVSSLVDPTDILVFVKNIDADTKEGKAIKTMCFRREGPCKVSSKAKPVTISVPGGHPEGFNYSCPDDYGETIEFLSNLSINGETLNGQTNVRIKMNGTLSSASNCREIIGYDFQLSCSDAKKIFSDKVLDCDNNHNPLWKIDKSYRKIPAYATKV
jgi:hypothetical protein